MRDNVSLEPWLVARRQAVDEALDRFLPDAAHAPLVIADAMRYSVFAGGKRLRPLLVLAAAEAVAPLAGLAVSAVARLALPAACAIELIHTYSLVHDDLPAMDNDTLRRGRPTAHVVYGEGTAILSGDALLTEAFSLLAREPRGLAENGLSDSQLAIRKLRAIEIIADAAGASGMVGGQALDLKAAEPGTPPLTGEGLSEMHARKTGALLRASALAGGVLAGGSTETIVAIGDFGSEIGLAFQIVDDILDVEGASVVLGKTAGKDAAAGKPTYPALYGIEESRRRADQCLVRALDVLDRAQLKGQLRAIAQWIVARTN